MAGQSTCGCCGHTGPANGPGLADRALLGLAYVALLVGACGGVMLGPHFTLFGLPLFLPPYMGLMSWAHTRALRTPECARCGRYLDAPAAPEKSAALVPTTR